MFNKSLFSLLIMFAITSPPALADTIADTISPYVGVTIGTPLTSINKLSDSSGSLNMDSNPGYMAGLTAGITFDSWGRWNIEKIRAEAEIGYRSSELTRLKNTQGQSVNVGGTVSVATIMVNGYLENSSLLSNDLPVTLFLTAGAGAAIASISPISNTPITSSRDTQLAYQGGAGFGYKLTKRITLDTTYKYLGTIAFNFAGIKAEYGSHNILFGARYLFK